ncbi:CDF family Co(II)/Ni(II) efflux transporter DmeF [Zymomonas mobilis]|uniref:Cation diffusion facilitator family transporter n=1 Tax=Zymomonas mobilis subsp. pomaceae (strain ATCC 29192 / DSM 22645 / JCM 10191 / CCUG 17912 / NBRC 13757 / NCIMB 11200 / NRRL B-4491 / Barker I) TaxID=579138 RepID=F8ETG2_ZYMMT|nr:CDF family Co(II)/Ni(II) efflux transporter DmeF [Zymomonas mobilis]AEI37987.1 cation diffusion facilitator family transporter [Zymomonas mobilis subsp. pomaceae ATCC 29192]MDX5949355.1 CDF family Co(II)/Ni(II) efflux transporter DmeF [Zymomonas mobilis subsp. pomaceae]GEB89913.1 metal transporter [Zymomonas mobilis subsp. pomaceae]
MDGQSMAEHRRHSHVFHKVNPLAERYTAWATLLTLVMMIAEIIGGWSFNSMALLADGWHMSSHALALGLSVLAYRIARQYAADNRFTFGTWKVEILGGYTSAVFLIGVAGLMFYQSVDHLISPASIHYDQAIIISAIGLIVNLICAWLLKDHAAHDHHSVHGGPHPHEHHSDLNQRSAYIHVIADAMTSVLAIIALLGGKLWGASWLDPLMGIIGSLLVAIWAVGLLRETSRILLDAEMDSDLVQEIHDVLKESPVKTEIADLHVWRVSKEKYACIISLMTDEKTVPDYFRKQLSVHEELAHVTVEINPMQSVV